MYTCAFQFDPTNPAQRKTVTAMLIRRMALVLACAGMLLPQGLIAATPPPVKKSLMTDVVLGSRGTLVGRVVDGRGRGLVGRTVRVQRGSSLIARVKTDRTGQFAVKNLPGGAYSVTCGSTAQLIRAWATGSAPPRTAAQVVLVDQPLVVRGQGGAAAAGAGTAAGLGGLLGVSTFGLVALGATAIVVPILIAESDDDAAPPASP
jgi:hypothetical protein